MAKNAFGDEIVEPAAKAGKVNAFGDPIVENDSPTVDTPTRTPYTPGSTSKPSGKKGNVLEKALMGTADLAAGAAKYVGAAVLSPYDFVSDAVTGNWGANKRRKAAADEFAKDKGADDWTSVVNQAVPELLFMGGPQAKVEQMVVNKVAGAAAAKAGEVMAKVPLKARAAGVAADTGVNAATSAAQAAADGEDPWEAAKRAAAIGLGIRGVAAPLTSVVRKGANVAVDKTADLLRSQGFDVTPGMLFPKTWASRAEGGAAKAPFVGEHVEEAEARLGRDYVNRKAQDSVDGLVRVVPGTTHSIDPKAPKPNPQTRPKALPRASAAAEPPGTAVGPSMVEPIPNRYPQPGETLHVDSSGNVGKLSDRNPAFDEDSGMFYSTQASRPADATNLPAPQMDTTIPRQPSEVGPARPVSSEVGPFTRDTVEGQGTSRYTPPDQNPSRAGQSEPETFTQTMVTEPRVAKVEGEGLNLANNVKQHIDDAYDEVVEHTFMRAGDGVSALSHARQDLNNISWLTPDQRKLVTEFIDDRLLNGMRGLGPDGILSGRQVKNLDSILGEKARSFAEKAETKPMSDALYAIQHRLRVATDGNTPAHRHALQMANEAFRKALPLIRATEHSLGGAGIPSSLQLREAMKHYGMKTDAVDDAMVQVAPHAPASRQANRRMIGSGLGLASVLGSALTGNPASLFALAGTGLAAGGAGRTLYSPAGVKAQIKLLEAPRKFKTWLEKQPYADQVKYLSSYASQSGARLGDNQGEENAP